MRVVKVVIALRVPLPFKAWTSSCWRTRVRRTKTGKAGDTSAVDTFALHGLVVLFERREASLKFLVRVRRQLDLNCLETNP